MNQPDTHVSGKNSKIHPQPGFSVTRRHFAQIAAFSAGAALVPRAITAKSRSSTAFQLDNPPSNSQNADQELVLPFDPYGQEVFLDPHRAADWGPFWVMLPYVWSGLLAFDENGAVVPDLAESVTPGDDASTWTCTIRHGITFASGKPVTAQHFVDSWKRALDPANLAPMVGYMAHVNGFDAFIAGESGDIGFEVTDDRTIVITLSEPVSDFPAHLATFVWAVIDLEQVAAAPLDFPLNDAGAGQWRFTEFADGDHITMQQNPHYWDGQSPSIGTITWPFMDSIAAASEGLDRYRNDEIASLDVPISMLQSIRDDEALNADLQSIDLNGSTLAIGMDFNQEPFNDVRIRQAIASAVDKDAWANDIWQGTYVPAASFTPPSTAEIAGYSPPTAPEFDPSRAADLLSEAEFTTGDAQSDIVYYQPATDSPEDQERHAALLQMIEDACGIRIRQDTSKTAEQIAGLQSDLGGRQFDIVWWWANSDTPSLLATVGHSESPFMQGWFNWSPELEPTDGEVAEASAAFDEHIADATSELDASARNDSYAEAEKLLLDNAVYVPLGYWKQQYIQKPWLKGTRQGPWSGRIPVRIDKDVTIER